MNNRYQRYNRFALSKLQVLETKLNRLLLIRFILLILFLVIVTFVASGFSKYYLFLLMVDAIAFGFLAYKIRILDDQVEYMRSLSAVCEFETTGNSELFRNGNEFKDDMHPFTSDLDTFGKDSLFENMNRTVSTEGYQKFARLLRNPVSSISEIQEAQKAVKELSKCPSRLVGLISTILSKRIKYSHPDQSFSNWLKAGASDKSQKGNIVLLRVFSLINLGLLIGIAFNPIISTLFLLSVILQSLFLIKYTKLFKQTYHLLDEGMKDIRSYGIIIKRLKKENYQSKLLREIHSEVLLLSDDMRRLEKMLNLMDNSLTAVGVALNFIFHLDLVIYFRLITWRDRHGNDLLRAIDRIAEYEALMSIALFAAKNEDFVYPELHKTSQVLLHATAIAHPLLNSSSRIGNDFTITKANACNIITGANMAGKSTFLRAIGVNILLARIGSPVCASSFECVPLDLFTSMRTTDSLGSGISYFYAEAIRLKQLESAWTNQENELLIIADELFRGTNSDDKLRASIAFIEKQLTRKQIVSLIATHDLGVTKLEQKYPAQIKNYCFNIRNHGNEMIYDYKITQGVTRTHNAFELLRSMGVI